MKTDNILQKWMVQLSLWKITVQVFVCTSKRRMHLRFAVTPPYRQRITPNHSPINRLLWISVRRNIYSPGRITRNWFSRNRQRHCSQQPILGTRVCNKTSRSNSYKWHVLYFVSRCVSIRCTNEKVWQFLLLYYCFPNKTTNYVVKYEWHFHLLLQLLNVLFASQNTDHECNI